MTRRDAATSTGPQPSTPQPQSPPPLPTSRNTPTRGRSRRRRRSVNSTPRRRSNLQEIKDEPFWITVFRVGVSLLLMSLTCYAIFLQSNIWTPQATEETIVRENNRIVDVMPKKQQLQASLKGNSRSATAGATATRVQHDDDTVKSDFDKEKAWTDAYGIASEYQIDPTIIRPSSTSVSKTTFKSFAERAELLRFQFATLVGGEEDEARAILQRSLLSFRPRTKKDEVGSKPQGITAPHALAHRILDKISSSNNVPPTSFSVAVLGSSSAAGSGNFFQQSYAFVIKKLLQDIFFQDFEIQLRVRNLAVEDVDELPTIWCLDHYFPGGMPDILIWDYGLTSTAETFEAFLRNVASQEKEGEGRAPFLIVRDTQTPNRNNQRNQLLQSYVDSNSLLDPMLVHVDQAAAPFLNKAEPDLPEGFQQWRTSFGSPPNAPGKEHTHLTVKQHSMIGWLISMHILSSLELVMADQLNDGRVLSGYSHRPRAGGRLPPPLVIGENKNKMYNEGEVEEREQSTMAWVPLLIGEPIDPTDSKSYYEFPGKGVQCRTTYITAYTNDTLDSVIVSGSLSGPLDPNALDSDHRSHLIEELLLPKGAMFYSKGWVRDLDKATKRQKQLTKQWDFLGFEEMVKKAYFGLPSSGDLNLFLPLSKSSTKQPGARASELVESVMLCETDLLKYHASEATSDSDHRVCRLKRDAEVFVGGEMAFLEPIPLLGVSSTSCVLMRVPEGASLSFRQDVVNKLLSKKNNDEEGVTEGDDSSHHVAMPDDNKNILGLPIDIRVLSDKGNFKEPCSLAHVIWKESIEGV